MGEGQKIWQKSTSNPPHLMHAAFFMPADFSEKKKEKESGLRQIKSVGGAVCGIIDGEFSRITLSKSTESIGFSPTFHHSLSGCLKIEIKGSVEKMGRVMPLSNFQRSSG